MGKYYIRVNCVGFQDFVVTAKNKKDAVNEAERNYQCESREAEFGEFLDEDSLVRAEELEVYYPVKSNQRKDK